MICDLAETYGVLNYKELAAATLSALVFGLRDDSRTKMAISGARYSTRFLLLASIRDSLAFLAWAQTEDGAKGRNRPASVLEKLLHPDPEDAAEAYDTPDAYELARAKIIGG